MSRIWTVRVAGPEPSSFRCPEDRSVLVFLAGTGHSPVTVGCRRGGCGICRVHVTAGSYRLGKMSAGEISGADREAGIVLACQVYPESDLELVALGREPRVGWEVT